MMEPRLQLLGDSSPPLPPPSCLDPLIAAARLFLSVYLQIAAAADKFCYGCAPLRSLTGTFVLGREKKRKKETRDASRRSEVGQGGEERKR